MELSGCIMRGGDAGFYEPAEAARVMDRKFDQRTFLKCLERNACYANSEKLELATSIQHTNSSFYPKTRDNMHPALIDRRNDVAIGGTSHQEE